MTRVCVGVRIQKLLSYPQHPDHPLGSFSLLAREYEGLFPRGQSGRDLRLTSRLSVAEITSAWSWTYTTLRRFVALCCTEHKHSLALILWNGHVAYLPNTSVITIFGHDRSSELSGWRTCVFGRLRVRISARRLAIYTDIFGGFSQSVHADAEIMLQIRVRQLLSKLCSVN
jgi:hypothetical protein